MVETVYCVHCGAVAKHPVTKVIDGQALHFCCGGCLQVYEMMREEGLLSEQVEPAAAAQWQPAQAAPDRSRPVKTIRLPVTGMTCANCAAHVKRSLSAVPGVSSVEVDLASAQATLELVSDQVTTADLRRAVQNAGYDVP